MNADVQNVADVIRLYNVAWPDVSIFYPHWNNLLIDVAERSLSKPKQVTPYEIEQIYAALDSTYSDEVYEDFDGKLVALYANGRHVPFVAWKRVKDSYYIVDKKNLADRWEMLQRLSS